MILHTEVNEDGTLNTIIPKSLWGKRIVITVEKKAEESDWEILENIFNEADKIDFPRRTHEEILRELNTFRETE
ncbi:MAG TPA: hypothetical protein VJL89_04190 [Thermodesulfovibrionia bacterium]|nr:hypothetical protein [Thermodesulfovibrionia bacterium]